MSASRPTAVTTSKNPDHEETLAALEYGPAMVLPKPVKADDLYSVLKIVFK